MDDTDLKYTSVQPPWRDPTRLTTRSTDRLLEALTPVATDITMSALTVRFSADLQLTKLPRIGLFRIRMDGVRVQSVLRDYVGVTIPLWRAIEAGVDGKPKQFVPGSAHVLRPEDTACITTTVNSGPMLVVNMDRKLVAKLLRQLADTEDPSCSSLCARLSLNTDVGADLYRTAAALWYDRVVCSGQKHSTLATAEAELKLATGLIASSCLMADRQSGIGTIVATGVKRAAEYIEANLTRPIGLGDLAEVAGVRPETLSRGFHKWYGVAPIEFIRGRRLEAAHRTLLGGDPECTSVSRVAFQLGFTHLSRFAQYYRNLFGELPSETLKV